jgi:hypothetical protein
MIAEGHSYLALLIHIQDVEPAACVLFLPICVFLILRSLRNAL